MTKDKSNRLVFFLIDDQGVGNGLTTVFPTDLPELVIDEQTPRFQCQHVTSDHFDLSEALVLKVCPLEPFMAQHWTRAARNSRGVVRRELSLLRQWINQQGRGTIAYQWALGADGSHPWRRPDDLVTYWEELSDGAQREMLSSVSPELLSWFRSGAALPLSLEAPVFSEVLQATAANLPLHEYIFRSLATGTRELEAMSAQRRYRLCDHTVRMFVRFPTYMSRRFLRGDKDGGGDLRACYLSLLATAFQFNVAPVSLERFCDYLSVKADCHGQERADLAWFVGELSLMGRPKVFLGAGLARPSRSGQGASEAY